MKCAEAMSGWVLLGVAALGKPSPGTFRRGKEFFKDINFGGAMLANVRHVVVASGEVRRGFYESQRQPKARHHSLPSGLVWLGMSRRGTFETRPGKAGKRVAGPVVALLGQFRQREDFKTFGEVVPSRVMAGHG
jgi:hypothetical protein